MCHFFKKKEKELKKLLLGVVCASLLWFPSCETKAKTSLKDIEDAPAVNVAPAAKNGVLENDHWAYRRLENITKKYGLLVGKPGEVFDGKKPLTRDEAAIILVNLIGKIEKDNVKMSELEKDQIDILKQELNSEVQKLAGRVDKLESSVDTLQGRISNIEGDTTRTWTHPFGEKMQLSGDLSVLYNGNFKRGSENNAPRNFDIDGTALYVSGKLHKHIDYVAGLDFNTAIDGSGKIIDDAYIKTDIIPHHLLHIGQVRVPIGQEGSMSGISSDNIKKAQISRNFSDKRDVGAKIIGRWGLLDYYAGVFNGSGQGVQDNNNALDIATWVMAKPFYKHPEWGVLEAGYGFDANKDKNDLSNTTQGAYLGYKYKKFKISSEFAKKNGYYDPLLTSAAQGHDRKAQGYYIRLAYDLTKKNQLLATYDVFDPNTGISNDTLTEYTLGGRYLLLKNLKFRYNYVHIANKRGRSSDRLSVMSTFCF